MSFYFLKCFDS